MLILTRKPGESVYIGDNVKITIVEIKGHQIRVGIDAPKELRIYREEIYEQILEENRQAATQNEVDDAGLDSLSAAWGQKPGAGGVSKLSSMKLSSKGGEKPSRDNKDGDDDPNGGGSGGGTSKGPEVVKRRKKRSN